MLWDFFIPDFFEDFCANVGAASRVKPHDRLEQYWCPRVPVVEE